MNSRQVQELQQLWTELEWRRCATDEAYFLHNYVYIPSEDDARGRVKFELFDYQHDLRDLISKNRFVVSLKARQLGYTTLAMAHGLWLALFKPGANILIVSRNQDSSNKNLAQARLAYRFLPEWMKTRGPKLENDSSKGMSFAYGDGMVSHMKAAACTSGVFAGETATFVIWDEAALPEPASLQDDVLRTLIPTTDAGGSMWIISTARGAHNRFAKVYRAAKKGESQFVAFFRPWFVSPFMRCSKDCNWCGGEVGVRTACTTRYDVKRRDFADEPWKFFQEYPSSDEEAFRESGRPRFVGLPTEDEFSDFPYRGDIVWQDDKTLAFEYDEHGPLRLSLLDPDPNGFYVIGADPSQGVGKDYSAAQLMTINEDGFPEIVGYYHSNTVQPPEFAAALDRLGRYFAGRQWAALLAVEDQGGQGSLPINELHRHLEYPNPYMHQNPGARRSRGSRFFAFPMTVDRRRAVIDRLGKYLAVRDGEFALDGMYPSLRVELGQFVTQETANKNIRYAADVGCNDDLVMSLAITLWVLIEEGANASPLAAPIEEKSYHGMDIGAPIREARERAILAAEEETALLWEAITLNSTDGLIISPKGIYGR